jgi:iron only hydrogenase large subunit-like protein
MALTARACKEEFPGNPVVFIGPCISKRKEGHQNPDVDYVMTMEELACLFNAAGISVVECPPLPLDMTIDDNSRRYCLSGGVARAVISDSGENIISETINGLSKKQFQLLAGYAKKQKAEGQLIEVMACEGGCISGPCSHEFPKDARRFFARNTEMLCDCPG